MAQTKSKRKAALSSNDNPPELLNITELTQAAKEATEKHKHSQKTRKDYNSARDRAVKWLHEACASATVDDVLGTSPEFVTAFDGSPNGCSGKALGLYIVQKCWIEGKGQSTGEVAHAAMKKYWEEL